jgi:hypothetical protein
MIYKNKLVTLKNLILKILEWYEKYQYIEKKVSCWNKCSVLRSDIVRCCIYLTTYDWIKSFLKITIERRAIYGNLENKINTLYLARRKFHS